MGGSVRKPKAPSGEGVAGDEEGALTRAPTLGAERQEAAPLREEGEQKTARVYGGGKDWEGEGWEEVMG